MMCVARSRQRVARLMPHCGDGRASPGGRVRARCGGWALCVSPPSERSAYRRAMRIAFRDPVETGDLAVDGDDLLAAGIPAGPEMKAVLDQLLRYVLEDPARNTRDALM